MIGSIVMVTDEPWPAVATRLQCLADGFGDDTVELVVVRTDHDHLTTYEAGIGSLRIRVVETPARSVGEGRRLGELLASAFPRVYLSGPVDVPGATVRALLEHLDTPLVRAARPSVDYATAHAEPAVRRYFRARARLRRAGVVAWGEGVFGLSAAARARLGAFEPGVCDDVLVAYHFLPHELSVVDGAPAVAIAPTSTAELARRLRDACLANAVEGAARNLSTTTWRTAFDVMTLAVTRPHRAVDALTYATLASMAHADAGL